ncbi:MAG: membrane protein insertase YidC [Myxococcota bacterium]
MQDTPDFKRLFMAVFLMTALLMGYNAFFGPKTKALQPAPAPVQSTDTAGVKTAPMPLAPPRVETLNTPIVTQSLTRTLPDRGGIRGGYQATFSSEGARVSDFSLTGYQNPVHLAPYLVAESRDGNLTLSSASRYQLVNQDASSIAFQKTTPEDIRVIRRYRFSETPFVLQHELEFKNLSAVSKPISINLVMDTHEAQKADVEQLAAAFRFGKTHERFPLKDIKEQPETLSGTLTYAGFDRRYFFISVAPEQNNLTESATTQILKVGEHEGMRISLRHKTFTLAPGATQLFSYSSYIGPKELKLLDAAGHGLSENIDYGWFGVLSRPLLWLLIYINQWVLNFGLAIILLTVLIKLLTFPLTQKSFGAQQQMKKISPQLKEIQKKYAHDKAMLGQQQMAFYKEQGINPMAGCLPILIQMPVWFALYQMLGNSVELYEQPFYGWITDLTKPDPYYVMPVVMGLSMLISQWIMPPAIDESQPQMKYVMWFMPVFLTFVMLSMPAGLSIYMLVNNLLTIAQQMYIKQRSEVSA